MHDEHQYVTQELYKTIATLTKENENLKFKLSDWQDTQKSVMSETCPSDEKHCTCVPMLKKEIKDKDVIIAEAGQKYNDLWNLYQLIKQKNI